MTAQPVETRLARCEAVIKRGLTTFVEVGAALREVRDDRLYRESHGTFEDYCRDRWGWGRRYANRTIAAADAALLVGPFGPTPANEAVARELVAVPAEHIEEVWGEVVAEHGPTPTAAQVREHIVAGPRIVTQQARVVKGIVDKARLIAELAPHLDLQSIGSITGEEKDEWKLQLSAARTVLSRVIGAL